MTVKVSTPEEGGTWPGERGREETSPLERAALAVYPSSQNHVREGPSGSRR